MEQRPFGRAGVGVSALGQGTWNIETDNRAEAVAALRRGLDLGMTHIDTAEMYGSGKSEKIIGEAIAGRRDEVFLVSKVLPQNASKRGTIAACEKSLAYLGTDRLDCYLLHWRGRYPLAETFAAFEDLKRAGKILSWGVSNFDVDDLEEAWGLAGDGGLVCNQVLYHLQERAIEHAVIPWCVEHNVAVVAYSPLGSGGFPSARSGGGKVLQKIADAHGATPHQVALKFLLARSPVLPIPKAARRDHVEANAAAAGLKLSEAELGEIDRAFPRGAPPRYLPMI